MSQLPADILYEIFLDIWASTLPSMLLNVCLVCQKWRQIAQRILNGRMFRLVIGPGTEEKNNRRFDRIDNDPGFRGSIHYIHVTEVFSSGLLFKGRTPHRTNENPDVQRGVYGTLEQKSEVTQRQLERLAKIISEAPALRTFRWDAKPRIPPVIVGALRNTTDCRIQVPFCYEAYYGPPIDGFAFPCIDTPDSLSALLPLAHRIRELGVVLPGFAHPHHIKDASVSRVPAHLEFRPQFTDEFAFDTNMFDTLGELISLAPLDSLSVHAAGSLFIGDIFYSVPSLSWLTSYKGLTAPLQLSSLRLTNFCLCMASADEDAAFQSSIHWPRLQSAHFTCPVLLDLLPSDCQLTSLTLCLDSPYHDYNNACYTTPNLAAVRQNILDQRILQQLVIYQGIGVFETDNEAADYAFLKHLGRTLRWLTIREPETLYPTTRKRLCLLPNTLVALGSTCPSLRDLEIPIPPRETESTAYLLAIGKHLKSVHNLTICAPIERPGEYPGRLPMNRITCTQAWSAILLSSSRLTTLKTLTLAVGAHLHGERFRPYMYEPAYNYQRRYFLEKKEPWELSVPGNEGEFRMLCHELNRLWVFKKWGDTTTYSEYEHNYEEILSSLMEEGLPTEEVEII